MNINSSEFLDSRYRRTDRWNLEAFFTEEIVLLFQTKCHGAKGRVRKDSWWMFLEQKLLVTFSTPKLRCFACRRSGCLRGLHRVLQRECLWDLSCVCLSLCVLFGCCMARHACWTSFPVGVCLCMHVRVHLLVSQRACEFDERRTCSRT